MPRITPSQALDRAIDFSGSAVALARALGVTRAAVEKWKHHTGRLAISTKNALKIEALTAGRVTAHQLRPDLPNQKGQQANGRKAHW